MKNKQAISTPKKVIFLASEIIKPWCEAMSIKAFSLRNTLLTPKVKCALKPPRRREGAWYFWTYSRERRCPKVAAPQADLHFYKCQFFFNKYAASGNLLVKFLCAAADYVAIPKKALITYPLINYRYLKSKASATMPLKPQSDERARGDLPRKSLCAATDIVTIPETLLIFPHMKQRHPTKQGKRNYFWTYSRGAALSKS